MNTTQRFIVTMISLLILIPAAVSAHGEKNVRLHINPRWSECSFQLDPSLTQSAWREFTREGALVAYFRPLTDAASMGAGNFEFSLLQWNTAFDDTKAAWNDTFVHPDSVHWLKEGDRLPFPAIMVRGGISEKFSAGLFWTKSPGGNYGFWGGQLQYHFIDESTEGFSASVRTTFSSMFGPADLDLTVIGADIVASKKFIYDEEWFSVTPYVGVSTYLSRSHEKTIAVSLKDETILGVQGMVGAVADVSFARLAVEYNAAAVSTLSFKLGFAF